MIFMRSSDLTKLPKELDPSTPFKEAEAAPAPAFKARVINDHQPSTGVVFTWTPPTSAKKWKKGKYVISKPTMRRIVADFMAIDRFYALLNSEVATGMSSNITRMLNSALADKEKGLQIYALSDFQDLVKDSPQVWELQKSLEIGEAFTAAPKAKVSSEPQIQKTPKQDKKKKGVLFKKGDLGYVEPRARQTQEPDYTPQTVSLKGFIVNCRADFSVMYKTAVEGIGVGRSFLGKEDDVDYLQQQGINSSIFSTIERDLEKIGNVLSVYLPRLQREYEDAVLVRKGVDAATDIQVRRSLNPAVSGLGGVFNLGFANDGIDKEVLNVSPDEAQSAYDHRAGGKWVKPSSEDDLAATDAHFAKAYPGAADYKKTKGLGEAVDTQDILEDLQEVKGMLEFILDLSEEDGIDENLYHQVISAAMRVVAQVSSLAKSITRQVGEVTA